MFSRLRRLLGLSGGKPAHDAGRPTDRMGPKSEQLARAFLQRAGLRILASNYRCPTGEIDIVAEHEGRLVFVEVKARRLAIAQADYIRPERAVTRDKQRRIGRAARYYCRTAGRSDRPVRFDVIAIDWPADGGEPAIRHHVSAFRPG